MFYNQFVRLKLQVPFCINSSFFFLPRNTIQLMDLEFYKTFPSPGGKPAQLLSAALYRRKTYRTRDQNQKQHICRCLPRISRNPKQSHQLKQIQPRDPVHKQNFLSEGIEHTTFVFSNPVLSPALFIYILPCLKISAWFAESRKKVWPSTARHVKPVKAETLVLKILAKFH